MIQGSLLPTPIFSRLWQKLANIELAIGHEQKSGKLRVLMVVAKPRFRRECHEPITLSALDIGRANLPVAVIPERLTLDPGMLMCAAYSERCS